MRYRKNINCLTADELHDLREAFTAMYARPASDPRSWSSLAGFHGGPPTAYCRHGSPGFLSWHRAYLLAFEEALLCHSESLALPFWDWSSGPSTGVPAACREATYVDRTGTTVPNPLFSGPRPGGGQTSRAADIDTRSFDSIATSAQAAVAATTFADFTSLMNGVHGSVHVRVSGDMGSVPSAGFDPIFYLHHANVDRLWARWQSDHPTAATPASELAFELPPFNRPFSNQWYTGADMESTTALGYQYRTFCLRWPRPRLWDLIDVRWTPVLARQVRTARLLVPSHHMSEASFEVRVFIDDPSADEKTSMVDNPALAGVAGMLGGKHIHDQEPLKRCLECGHVLTAEHTHEGHGHAGHGSAAAVAATPHKHGHEPGRERFDIQIDITEALARHAKDEGVQLKLVVVDPDGRRLDQDELRIEDIELVLD